MELLKSKKKKNGASESRSPLLSHEFSPLSYRILTPFFFFFYLLDFKSNSFFFFTYLVTVFKDGGEFYRVAVEKWTPLWWNVLFFFSFKIWFFFFLFFNGLKIEANKRDKIPFIIYIYSKRVDFAWELLQPSNRFSFSETKRLLFFRF